MERELDSTSTVKSTFSLDTLRLTLTVNVRYKNKIIDRKVYTIYSKDRKRHTEALC